MAESVQGSGWQRLVTRVRGSLYGLRPRMLAAILAIYIVAVVLMFVGFVFLDARIAGKLGVIYAQMQVRANKSLIQEPLTREIALARQMAASPLLRSWARDEENPQLRSQALAELESFRQRFLDGSWFYVIDSTRHYYFNNASNSFAGKELAYTLSPERPSDAWYFATRDKVSEWAINVSPGDQLGVVKVWINVIIRDLDGRAVGMTGSGLDLSVFLRRFIDRKEPGIENVLIDADLRVQAHPNRALIDFNAITRTNVAPVTLSNVLGQGNLERIKPTLDRVSSGADELGVVPLTINGRRCLVGVSYLPEMKWYTLAVVDFWRIVDWRLFLPLLALGVLSMLGVAVLVGWVIDRQVLRRLVPLAKSVRCLEQGDYTVRLDPDRDDEIGRLMAAFTHMANAVFTHTGNLETRVQERTESLEMQKEVLDKKNQVLQQTLEHVSRLERLLPVCSGCKRIRVGTPSPGGHDQWVSLEDYVRHQMPVKFSHGVCDECLRTLYPGIADEVIKDAKRPPDAPPPAAGA